MTFVAIDIGNTNLVGACYDGKAWGPVQRLETGLAGDRERLLTWCDGLLPRGDPARVTVGLASVVPSLDPLMQEICADRQWALVEVTAERYPWSIRYPQPEEVGADRLADSAAAYRQYGGPAIVIDFGTATTFDYIDADGGYWGGPITPGILLAQRALSHAAAKLPAIEFAAPSQLLPRTTVEAMQAGIYFGGVGAVTELLRRLQSEVGGTPRLIATGGLAPIICPQLPFSITQARTLTLDGILLLCSSPTSP